VNRAAIDRFLRWARPYRGEYVAEACGWSRRTSWRSASRGCCAGRFTTSNREAPRRGSPRGREG
jgi:hypothetical protein